MIEQLVTQIHNCYKCDLRSTLPPYCRPVCVLNSVNISSKIMILGETCGENEILMGEPFVGLAGKMLNRILAEAGIERSSCYITNTVKCWSRLGKKNIPLSDSAIQACKPWLWEEIKLVKPKIIVTLGKVPTSLLLKLKKLTPLHTVIGKIHEMDRLPKIAPAYHPSFLLRGNKEYLKTTIDVFKMVKNESST